MPHDRLSNEQGLEKLLSIITNKDEGFSEELIKDLIVELSSPKFENLWIYDVDVNSYWILLLNGINNTFETDLAKEFLFWKEFFSRDTVQAICLQSSDQSYFNICLKKFGILHTPAFIISNDIEFREYIVIGYEDIKKKISRLDSISSFLNTVHFHLINNVPLTTLKHFINTNEFISHIDRVNRAKKLLNQGKTESAIGLLFEVADTVHENYLIGELTNIRGQFKQLQSHGRQNTISKSEIIIQQNQIVQSLFSICVLFEQEYDK